MQDRRWIRTIRHRPPEGEIVEFVQHNLRMGVGRVVDDVSIYTGPRIVGICDVRQWRMMEEPEFDQDEQDCFECPVCHGNGLECTWCYDTGWIKASDWKDYVPQAGVSDDSQ